ncbi:ABC transporter permease [Acrocarpospora macrocephala]|uniref:Putative ABC transporter (ATP-binding protein) n=1 Tax=Acrocarpospora macrocephala TaxID=150177 RepID=A0A5M3X5Y5_9ACTN|nr:ABC transporter permease [Acrocarpospora macrocephala]GES15061.1 putative ABC transporter (ATP-binding protein) [Acrocarpospora macrocephala]
MRPHPVLALVAANLRRHSRDRVGLFFIVVMPFVSIIFVGMALGGGTAASRLPVGVVAQGSDPVAAAVLTELRAHPDLEITTVGDKEELRAGVREGSLAAGLVIPPGSTRFELVMTQSNGSGMAARSAVDVAVGKVAAVLEATRAATSAGATPAEAAALVRKAQDASADVEVVNSDTASGTPRGFAYTAPANLLLFTFINSMAVAAALAESRRIGMLQRAFTAPVRRGAVLFGEALSRFLVAAAQAVLIMVVSSLLFGVSWGEPLGVATVVGVFALVSTGAAILMGSLVRSSAQPSAIGPPLGIVLGMLGGCLWPSEAAGDVLNAIGRLFPHAWGMDALLTLSRPGTGLGDVLLDVAVLALMAAALLSLSLVLFSRRTRTL